MAGIRSIKRLHHTGSDMDADCSVRRVRVNRLKNGQLARAPKVSSENVAVSDCETYERSLVTN
jgi:hypothetical protein